MHHSVNAHVSEISSGLPFTYSRVIHGVSTPISTVTAASSVTANVTILLSCSSALSALSVRTMCGTSTALKMPPDTSV